MRFKFGKIKINQKAVIKDVLNGAKKSKEAASKTRELAQERVEEAKKELLRDFESREVTKEIEAGPENTTNYSRTLSGLPYGKGSLFGFIGFTESDKPMDIVRMYLTKAGKLAPIAKKVVRKNQVSFDYTVRIPSMNEIESITPMPWEGGRSWVRAIERGISGLGYYLLTKSKSSRSGQGIQASNQLRTATYRPTKYMSNIINNYVNFLKTGKKVTKR
tara:strand:- start:212 stop:865 length:654 start_codon:yes stop_codon:yes gene_type:complete